MYQTGNCMITSTSR